jgi:hypothetical protein
MPTLQSEYYAAQVNQLVRYRADSGVAMGEIRESTYEYKFGWKAGVIEASGDILQLGQLDNGVVVHADDITVLSEGIGGTTVTFTAVGDQQTANRYTATAIPLTAAGYAKLVPAPATTIPEVKITGGTNDVIQGTLGGTLPATPGKRIWVRVRWRPV